jgi:hypothetical protein
MDNVDALLVIKNAEELNWVYLGYNHWTAHYSDLIFKLTTEVQEYILSIESDGLKREFRVALGNPLFYSLKNLVRVATAKAENRDQKLLADLDDLIIKALVKKND